MICPCTELLSSGHKKRFPAIIETAREQMEKEKMKQKREEEKQRREEELSTIKLERKLAKARERRRVEGGDLAGQFKSAVLARYGSVRDAWAAFDITPEGAQKGFLSRSDFKRIIHTTLGISCSDVERRQLRAKLDPQKSKRVALTALENFIMEREGGDNQKNKKPEKNVGALAVLPMEVPSLPDSFQPRTDVKSQLVNGLLTTSKSCVVAQGM
jgi:hypothetical protein